MKQCIKCAVELTPENWRAEARGNWSNKCLFCLREEKRAYAARWRQKHPGAQTKRSIKSKALLRQTDPVKARAQDAYNDCRKRALKNGLQFDLTPAFILAMMREALVCPYFGWPLTYKPGGKDKTLASLDRIDSSGGYMQGNVRVISYLANLMKSSASDAELTAFANGVLRFGLGGLRTVEKLKDKA